MIELESDDMVFSVGIAHSDTRVEVDGSVLMCEIEIGGNEPMQVAEMMRRIATVRPPGAGVSNAELAAVAFRVMRRMGDLGNAPRAAADFAAAYGFTFCSGMTHGELVLGLMMNRRRVQLRKAVGHATSVAIAEDPLKHKDLLIEAGVSPRQMGKLETEQWREEGREKARSFGR